MYNVLFKQIPYPDIIKIKKCTYLISAKYVHNITISFANDEG